MIKKLIALFCVSLVATAVFAQSFLENEFQRKGREYEREANTALADGDYEKAAEFAELASIEYRKSREYADAQLLMYRAANAISLAEAEIAALERTPRVTTHAAELARAKSVLAEAKNLYSARNWTDSRAKALQALELARAIPRFTSDASVTLPRYYVVVRRDSNHDCFWNIAKMPEVYNNPFLWPRLYQANKTKLRDPENPNLIFPGMIVEIPAVRGETREGTYEPGRSYPKLPD